MYLKDENAPYTIQISSLKYDIYPLFLDKSGIKFSLKRTTQKQMVILYQKTGFKCLYYDFAAPNKILKDTFHLRGGVHKRDNCLKT